MKKKFKDTKVGIFLKEKAPGVLNIIGDVLPDKGIIGIVKNLITTNNPELEKEFLEKENEFLTEMETLSIEFEKTVSQRWQSDMNSDSWLSKNTRPITMLSLLSFLYVIVLSDSFNIAFEVKDIYIDLMQILLTTTVVAYFGSRGVEKYHSIKKNK